MSDFSPGDGLRRIQADCDRQNQLSDKADAFVDEVEAFLHKRGVYVGAEITVEERVVDRREHSAYQLTLCWSVPAGEPKPRVMVTRFYEEPLPNTKGQKDFKATLWRGTPRHLRVMAFPHFGNLLTAIADEWGKQVKKADDAFGNVDAFRESLHDLFGQDVSTGDSDE